MVTTAQMKRPLVAFDIDGVLTDFALAFTSLAYDLTGRGVVRGQKVQQTWTFSEDPATPSFTERAARHSREDEAETWEEIGRSETFWYDQPSLLVEADVLAMERLAEDHDIVYITDRKVGREPLLQTIRWLLEEKLPQPSNVMCRGLTGMSKKETVMQLEPVALLEDSPKNLKECEVFPTRMDLYRMVYPYNEGCPGTPVRSVEAYCFAVLGQEVWK